MNTKDRKVALIDGDILVYRAGFASERNLRIVNKKDGTTVSCRGARELKKYMAANSQDDVEFVEHDKEVDPSGIARYNMDESIDKIKRALENVTEWRFYISCPGSENFRSDIATIAKYKGNRDVLHKPVHYKALREYLQSEYGAHMSEGQEADDDMGIASTEMNGEKENTAIVVSIDKDLNMIPGWHYNWVKDRAYKTTAVESLRHFYSQMLTGDVSDNIPGIYGVGPKTAERVLDGATDAGDMWYRVQQTWHEHYPGGYEFADTIHDVDKVLKEIGTLLWIRRHKDEIWTPPF